MTHFRFYLDNTLFVGLVKRFEIFTSCFKIHFGAIIVTLD